MRKITISILIILVIAISCQKNNSITGTTNKKNNTTNQNNSSNVENTSNSKEETTSEETENEDKNISVRQKEKLKIYIEDKVKNPMETDSYFLLTGFGGFDSPDDIIFKLGGEDIDYLISTATQLSLQLKVISIEGIDPTLFRDNKKVKQLLHRAGSYSGRIVDLRGKNFSKDVFNINLKRDMQSGKISVSMTANNKLAQELKSYVKTSKDTSVIKVTLECSTEKIQKSPNTIELYIVASSI